MKLTNPDNLKKRSKTPSQVIDVLTIALEDFSVSDSYLIMIVTGWERVNLFFWKFFLVLEKLFSFKNDELIN